jgi:hypothetical protein
MKKTELSPKKPYTKPTLTKHKSLRDVTAGAGGSRTG